MALEAIQNGKFETALQALEKGAAKTDALVNAIGVERARQKARLTHADQVIARWSSNKSCPAA